MRRRRLSDWQLFSAAALRAIGPRSLSEGRRAMRHVAAVWRRRSNPMMATPDRLENPRKKRRPPSGGDWQPDLFGGRGLERREGLTRSEQLELARQEMRDTGSPDLFDLIPRDLERNPSDVARIPAAGLGGPMLVWLGPYLERHGVSSARTGRSFSGRTTYVDVPTAERDKARRLIREYKADLRAGHMPWEQQPRGQLGLFNNPGGSAAVHFGNAQPGGVSLCRKRWRDGMRFTLDEGAVTCGNCRRRLAKNLRLATVEMETGSTYGYRRKWRERQQRNPIVRGRCSICGRRALAGSWPPRCRDHEDVPPARFEQDEMRKRRRNPPGELAPRCPSCGDRVRLPNPPGPTATCHGCGQRSEVRRP